MNVIMNLLPARLSQDTHEKNMFKMETVFLDPDEMFVIPPRTTKIGKIYKVIKIQHSNKKKENH